MSRKDSQSRRMAELLILSTKIKLRLESRNKNLDKNLDEIGDNLKRLSIDLQELTKRLQDKLTSWENKLRGSNE